eukprot:COSAG01_NODE_7802_length_3052_cov_1.950220_1_plen_632_part_00
MQSWCKALSDSCGGRRRRGRGAARRFTTSPPAIFLVLRFGPMAAAITGGDGTKSGRNCGAWLLLLLLLLLLAGSSSAAAATAPAPPDVAAFNAVFHHPSFDGPAQNMPVGNGEVVANVWVDGVRNGSLALLLGRSDVFSGMAQPLKLGRLRIELEPNPYAGWYTSGGGDRGAADTPSFQQTLDLSRGLITISAGAVTVTVWSDINSAGTADSVHVSIASPGVPTRATLMVDSWRLDPTYVDCRNNARGPCGGSPGSCNLTLPPDTLVAGSYYSDPQFQLGWYRRNELSVFKSTLADQGLGALADRLPDPLMNRTSGAIVIASTAGGAAFERRNATHAVSRSSAERHSISLFTHTMLAEDQANAFDFLKQTMLRAKAAASPAMALRNHTAWWASFWNRSWVMMTADPADAEAAVAAHALSEAYSLHRYLMAIQSRGALPTHHNGGTVCWGWNGSTHADPDYRSWGGGYWFQNVRHEYWYALLAGDYDLMHPLYKMYMEQLPGERNETVVLLRRRARNSPATFTSFDTHSAGITTCFAPAVMRERSVQWYKHNGTRFAETSYFYGSFEPCDYGCDRKASDPPDPASPYIRNHIQGRSIIFSSRPTFLRPFSSRPTFLRTPTRGARRGHPGLTR